MISFNIELKFVLLAFLDGFKGPNDALLSFRFKFLVIKTDSLVLPEQLF